MKVTIHRGANEIGGNCVELECDGQRIVLDVGLPINCDLIAEIPLPHVTGFRQPDPNLLAVVISHPHPDHYGLASQLPDETMFIMGAAGRRILEASGTFTSFGLSLKNSTDLIDRIPLQVGPFTLTPYLVDHSAYDSYSLLIEAGGKKLFYSGDFRGHGRKRKLIDRFLASPPADVDCLLLEGTNISRTDDKSAFPTESDLETEMVEIFRNTVGLPLVWCSAQNIDRIVTIFRACRKANRQLIIDMYTAEILRATQNEKIPQANWDSIRVFLPSGQRRQVIRGKAFDMSNSYARFRIYPEALAENAMKSVMLFRPSMIDDLDKANCIENATVLYSIWAGYLGLPQNDRLHQWVAERQLSVHHCHTSGHACIANLKRMRSAFPNATVVPIHLDDVKRFTAVFPDARIHCDGEVWCV